MSTSTINLRGGWNELVTEHVERCSRPHPVEDISAEQIARMRNLLGGITYRDWAVRLIEVKAQALMQVATIVPDSRTGEPIENYSRPLALCPEMSDGLILDLAFDLIKEFELHEAAERFQVDGTRVYFPHNSSGAPLFEVPAMHTVCGMQHSSRGQPE